MLRLSKVPIARKSGFLTGNKNIEVPDRQQLEPDPQSSSGSGNHSKLIADSQRGSTLQRPGVRLGGSKTCMWA